MNLYQYASIGIQLLLVIALVILMREDQNKRKVGKFEKVSFNQFYSAMKDEFYEHLEPEIKESEYLDVVKEMYDSIELPSRATTGSAGYDFKSPITFKLMPGQTVKIPTGIRVKIKNGWWLGCLPRSSFGFKYRAQLDNTMGVIDSDYYYSDNEGHIFVKMTNNSKDFSKELTVNTGDSFVQGIFIPYGTTNYDNTKNTRNGGIGSTGR